MSAHQNPAKTCRSTSLQGGCRAGAKDFFIAGWVYCVQAMKMTKSSETRRGSHCCLDGDADSFFFLGKKMCYHIVTDFRCKAASNWTSRDERREMDPTHKQWGKHGRKTQLDFILGPKMKSCKTFFHNKVKLLGTQDNYSVYATIQEDDAQGYFSF